MNAAARPTVETRAPHHVIVWRGGVPTVVSYMPDGRTELAARAFSSDWAAIAYLARLGRW